MKCTIIICLIAMCCWAAIKAQVEDAFNYECRLKSEPVSVTMQSRRVVGSPGKRGPAGPQGPKGSKGDMIIITDERLQSNIQSYLESTNKNECPGHGMEGIMKIYPAPYDTEGIKVYCDTSTEGGRWIVLQRREDGSVDFYREWRDYVQGFGSKTGEFWIGLETIHRLTHADNYELYIELVDFDGERSWAKYTTFKIGDAASQYTLTIDGYTGSAAEDSLRGHNNRKFSTKDADNDLYSGNCAELYTGAWWYSACHTSNLNGKYMEGGAVDPKGITFYRIKNNRHYSFKYAQMKIRKISN